MELKEIREKLNEIIDSKKRTQLQIAYESGLGYQTIRNILSTKYRFVIKQTTLKKVEDYINAL